MADAAGQAGQAAPHRDPGRPVRGRHRLVQHAGGERRRQHPQRGRHRAVARPAGRRRAARSCSDLATVAGRRPVAVRQMEDQNRLAMESGTAAFELNYPFVYPSMKTNKPRAVQELQVGAVPVGRRPASRRTSPSAASTWRSAAYSQAPRPRVRGGAVPAQPENQKIAAIKGGLPPTLASLYDDPDARRGTTRSARTSWPSLADGQRAADDAGLPERLDRHLPHGLAAGRHRARRARRTTMREPASTTRSQSKGLDPVSARQAPGHDATADRVAAGPRRRRTGRKAQLSEGARAERRLGWLLCAPAVIVMIAVTAYPIVLRDLPVAAALRPALPRPGQVHRPEQLRRRADARRIWWQALRGHRDHHGDLGRHRAGAGHGARPRHAPHALRPRARSAPSILIPYGIVTVVAAFSWQYAWTPEHRLPVRRCSGDGRAAHRPRPRRSPSSSWPRCGRRRRSWRCC